MTDVPPGPRKMTSRDKRVLAICLGVLVLIVAVMVASSVKDANKESSPRYRQVQRECIQRELAAFGERSYRIGTRDLTEAATRRINRCMTQNY